MGEGVPCEDYYGEDYYGEDYEDEEEKGNGNGGGSGGGSGSGGRDDNNGCECTDKTYLRKSDNPYHGNCLTPDRNGKHWCYVKGVFGEDQCCQGKTARFKDHCVNFDLCVIR